MLILAIFPTCAQSTTASLTSGLQKDSAHGFSFSEVPLPHRVCSTCAFGSFFVATMRPVLIEHVQDRHAAVLN